MPPVILDSVELNDRGGDEALKPLNPDPFINVVTGVGLIAKKVVGKSDVDSANSTEELIQKEDENTEGLKSSGKNWSLVSLLSILIHFIFCSSSGSD